MQKVEIKLHSSMNNKPSCYSIPGFALVSKNHELCHSFSGCQSYISDIMRAARLGKWVGYQAFSYTIGTDPPIDFTKYRLAVWEEKEQAENSLKALHLFEKDAGIRLKTKLFETQHPNIWYYVASKNWGMSPFTISLFAQLIRMSNKGSVIDFSTKESYESSKQKYFAKQSYGNHWGYFNSTHKYLFNILPNVKEISYEKYNNFPTHDYNTFHGYGIVSLCTGYVKEAEMKTFIKEKITIGG